MNSIKKLMLIGLFVLGLSNISNAFTFNGYRFGSEPLFSVSETTKDKNKLLVFNSENAKLNKKINDRIDREVHNFTKDTYSITEVMLTGNNSAFISTVLINSKPGSDEVKFKGLVFDAKTGDVLSLSDVLGNSDSLKNLLNDRIAQFGIKTNSHFKGMSSVSSFYLEEDALILIFDKGRASDDFDGVVFVPLLLTTIQDVLR